MRHCYSPGVRPATLEEAPPVSEGLRGILTTFMGIEVLTTASTYCSSSPEACIAWSCPCKGQGSREFCNDGQ